MKYVLFFLGGFLGVVVILGIIAFIIYTKLSATAKSMGFSNLKQLKKEIDEQEIISQHRKKSISGMGSILMPKILADFPNFSESEIFEMTESGLLGIFSSLETKKVSKIKVLTEMRNILNEEIEEMNRSNIKVNYDDIIFHKHALKSYKKEDGVLSIEVNTSLEYNFEKYENDKLVIKKKDYKKQSSITTKFIYIFDADKYDPAKSMLGVHCPNCGAPLKSIDDRTCKYCTSGLTDINLRSWYIISYSEKY